MGQRADQQDQQRTWPAIDGLDRGAIQAALRAGIEAACLPGIVEVSAGNYGGKLGKHLFPLRELFPDAPA